MLFDCIMTIERITFECNAKFLKNFNITAKLGEIIKDN